jgi:hypothetical protein
VSRRRWTGALIFAAAAAVTSIFFIDFCDAVFRCGCASLWNGVDAHCNIHLAGSRHCPWCAHGMIASTLPWALIVAAQAAISFWPRTMHAVARLASAVLAFPLVGALIALAYGISTGYWR